MGKKTNTHIYIEGEKQKEKKSALSENTQYLRRKRQAKILIDEYLTEK